jgi:hypothetical protein
MVCSLREPPPPHTRADDQTLAPGNTEGN